MTIKHAFSIDLEDWYQGIELRLEEWAGKENRLEFGLDVILRLLDETCTKCTFFSLGWIAEKFPDVITKIAGLGHEIASHGYFHEKVYTLNSEKFREDIKRTKGIIEDITGTAVKGNRSPYFSITRKSLWALSILQDEGFEYDCSISPIETWRYGISSSPENIYRIKEVGIVEYPLSTFSLLGKRLGVGGAYFRIFPYFFFKNVFREKTRSQHSGMFYAHPWEFDPDHPIVSFDWRAKLTHYFNLKGMERRTLKLLKCFPFARVADIIREATDSGSVTQISIKSLEI